MLSGCSYTEGRSPDIRFVSISPSPSPSPSPVFFSGQRESQVYQKDFLVQAKPDKRTLVTKEPIMAKGQLEKCIFFSATTQ